MLLTFIMFADEKPTFPDTSNAFAYSLYSPLLTELKFHIMLYGKVSTAPIVTSLSR